MNVVSTITSDISSRLASLPVALMLVLAFLVNDRSHIDSLLTCIESFYQELQQGVSLRQRKLGYWFILTFAVTLRSFARFGLQLKLLPICLLLLTELV